MVHDAGGLRLGLDVEYLRRGWTLDADLRMSQAFPPDGDGTNNMYAAAVKMTEQEQDLDTDNDNTRP